MHPLSCSIALIITMYPYPLSPSHRSRPSALPPPPHLSPYTPCLVQSLIATIHPTPLSPPPQSAIRSAALALPLSPCTPHLLLIIVIAHHYHAPYPFRLSQSAICSAALALSRSRPLLLEGPPGCGKSALLQFLAEATGNASTMVRLHLDDQMDSKVSGCVDM